MTLAALQLRDLTKELSVSRKNKVNPDHYTMAGRLTPDDLARERKRQAEAHRGAGGGGNTPTAPWRANEAAGGMEDEEPSTAEAVGGAETPEAVEPMEPAEGARTVDKQPQGMPRRRAAKQKGAAAARKGNRVAPRRKVTGDAPGQARRKSTKASGARGTPKTRKAPSARGSAARRGRTKGKGRTRKTQKKR